jgi:hypothetical protein
MQRFDENRGRADEVDEGEEENLDYEYEQVEENGEDAVGPRRSPKDPEKAQGVKIGGGNPICHGCAQPTAMPEVSAIGAA